MRIGAADRHGKSLAGIHGKANRGGVLCSVMAKVQLGEVRRIRLPRTPD